MIIYQQEALRQIEAVDRRAARQYMQDREVGHHPILVHDASRHHHAAHVQQQHSRQNEPRSKKPKNQGMKREEIEWFATVKYKKSGNENASEEERKCSICLTDFEDDQEIRFLACFHRFHQTCIDDWLIHNAKCPLCKKDLKSLMREMHELTQTISKRQTERAHQG